MKRGKGAGRASPGRLKGNDDLDTETGDPLERV
jgi:hypothetical protein